MILRSSVRLTTLQIAPVSSTMETEGSFTDSRVCGIRHAAFQRAGSLVWETIKLADVGAAALIRPPAPSSLRRTEGTSSGVGDRPLPRFLGKGEGQRRPEVIAWSAGSSTLIAQTKKNSSTLFFGHTDSCRKGCFRRKRVAYTSGSRSSHSMVRLEGASHREIAEALIGEPRVQADFIANICVTASAAPFGAAVCSKMAGTGSPFWKAWQAQNRQLLNNSL